MTGTLDEGKETLAEKGAALTTEQEQRRGPGEVIVRV